jgi:hypothetical protein
MKRFWRLGSVVPAAFLVLDRKPLTGRGPIGVGERRGTAG